MKTYYEILQVHQKASNDMIKAAYRALVKKYHPDNCKDSKLANEMMNAINEAYDVLSNPEKRKKYDEYLVYKSGNSHRTYEDYKMDEDYEYDGDDESDEDYTYHNQTKSSTTYERETSEYDDVTPFFSTWSEIKNNYIGAIVLFGVFKFLQWFGVGTFIKIALVVIFFIALSTALAETVCQITNNRRFRNGKRLLVISDSNSIMILFLTGFGCMMFNAYGVSNWISKLCGIIFVMSIINAFQILTKKG